MFVLEWERFGLKSFWKDTSLSIYTERERGRETYVIPEGFEAKFFLLKYSHATSECKIHSIEVDLNYFK